jgi:hypothetical protein
LAKVPRHRDPLAEALRTQRIRRFVIAVTIITFLCFTPSVFELVNRLVPGRLPVWLLLSWLIAIVCIAVAVERHAWARHDSFDRRGWPR